MSSNCRSWISSSESTASFVLTVIFVPILYLVIFLSLVQQIPLQLLQLKTSILPNFVNSSRHFRFHSKISFFFFSILILQCTHGISTPDLQNTLNRLAFTASATINCFSFCFSCAAVKVGGKWWRSRICKRGTRSWRLKSAVAVEQFFRLS